MHTGPWNKNDPTYLKSPWKCSLPSPLTLSLSLSVRRRRLALTWSAPASAPAPTLLVFFVRRHLVVEAVEDNILMGRVSAAPAALPRLGSVLMAAVGRGGPTTKFAVDGSIKLLYETLYQGCRRRVNDGRDLRRRP